MLVTSLSFYPKRKAFLKLAVKKMVDVGKSVLSENNGDVNDMRLGFHWPPVNSVSHLHLHVISPVSEMGFLAKVVYKPDTFWFVTVSILWSFPNVIIIYVF